MESQERQELAQKSQKLRRPDDSTVPSFLKKTYSILEVTRSERSSVKPDVTYRRQNFKTSSAGMPMGPQFSSKNPTSLVRLYCLLILSTTILPPSSDKYSLPFITSISHS